MAFHGKNKNFLESLKHAVQGIVETVHSERNIKIHFVITIAVFFAGILFKINRYEWMSIVICIGLVIGLELLNTSIENAVDLACRLEYHELAKKAKDASAGAVLIVVIMSVIIGMLIFIPKIIEFVF